MRVVRQIGAVCLAVLCGLHAGPAAGTGQPMVFAALGLEDGLSQSTVNAVFQDSRGFIWLATENGLNRYSGQRITSYFRDSTKDGGLPGDFIWDIAEDRRGDLWLATEGAGLVRWERARDRFVASPGPAGENLLARALHIDARGHIWVGTRGAGLLQFDAQGRLLRSYRKQAGDAASLSSNTVSAIASSPDGLWLGTDAGVDHLDTAQGRIEHLPLPLDQAVAISSLWPDADALWAGSYEQGLFRLSLNRQSGRQFRHDPDDADSLSSNQVRDLLRDRDGRLWVATQAGLNLYLGSEAGFRRYRHRDSDRYSLSDDLTMSLYQSADGVLWVGTRQGGVNRWNPDSWKLGSTAPAAMAGAVVLAFADAEEEAEVWVGGFGMPLLRLDEAGELRAKFSPEFGYPAREEGPVTSLLRGRDGQLWIGSMNAGLSVFDPARQRLRELRHAADRPDSLGANGIMSLFEDGQGNVWVGSFGGGLARVDPGSLAVTRFTGTPDDPAALAEARVTAITQDPQGRIWIGTDGAGLARLDPDSGQMRRFRPGDQGQGDLAANTIYSLAVDADGGLWIGTAGAGLNHLPAAQLQRDQPVFEHLGTRQGLSSNVINGIRIDDTGHLWLSSTRGIMRLDPRRRQFRYFHRAQGLQSEEFNFGAHHQSADGRIFFGGTGGYNALRPAALEQQRPGPRLVLTAVEKFSLPLATDQPVSDLQALSLRHDEDVISFEYAALDFVAPQRNLYSVKLAGFDREWTPPSYRNRSTYTNLDPGEYTLLVRAANSDGTWNPQALSLAITVHAAPWATPWAYAAYLLLGAAALWGFLRWRMRVLEREARIRQLAYYDRVTGLPNRDLFELRCREALRQSREEGHELLVICLRFGPLKRLHESLSAMSLDELVGSLGQRLNQCVFGSPDGGARRGLARLSEHEFIAFFRVPDAQQEGMHWARRLHEALAAPLGMDEHEFRLPVSAGIASYPAHADTVHALIRFASTAAGDVPSSADTPFRFYDQSMMRRALERLALESHLRQAIEQDQLGLHLQGKFSCDGELLGAEALCRWQHPERGAVSPGVFVPLAEESDLILALDHWVLGQVCQTLHRWQRDGHAALGIAVNVSAESFVSGRIIESLRSHCRAWAIPPQLLEVEITESVLARDIERAIEVLGEIKAMGHILSLDDFGTGYSSLTYLQRFPIDKLKIDQSFVRDLESDPGQQALCSSIIALARSMELITVAEGVETAAQLEYLRQLGCDEVQGYLLHRPTAAETFTAGFEGRDRSG